MGVPWQQYDIRLGVAKSTYLVKERSCTLALAVPEPEVSPADPVCVIPQVQLTTWMVSEYGPTGSPASPAIPSSFMNMSTAIVSSPFHVSWLSLGHHRRRHRRPTPRS